MRELGVTVPDPASVKVPLWLRLQARIAPVDRLLAAREAAEDEEVADTYRRSTGDPDTDTLLREIRREERSHSRAVADIRSNSDGAAAATAAIRRPGTCRSGWTSCSAARSGIRPAAAGSRVRSTAPTTASRPCSGSSPACPARPVARSFVLTAGVAGAIASALSMATGAFLAERSEAELMAANVERERQEIAEHPEEEKEELSLFYQLKGIDEATADELVEQLSKNPDAMLRALAQEEFGSVEAGGDPKQAAVAAGISTGLGAIIPVIPFFFTTGTVAIVAAAVISLVAHFLVGAAKSLVTLRSWWSAGLEMTLAGAIVGGSTFLIGLALPT